MDLTGLLTTLGNAAKTLLPMIVPGATPLIAAGKAISEAFNSVKTANGGTAPAEAQADHDALFDRVKAHADSTLSRLEGN